METLGKTSGYQPDHYGPPSEQWRPVLPENDRLKEPFLNVMLYIILIPRYLNTRHSFSDEQLFQFMGSAHHSLSKG